MWTIKNHSQFTLEHFPEHDFFCDDTCINNCLSQTNNWLIDKTISICNWLTTGNSWDLLFANETIFQHNWTNAVKWLNWDRYNANSTHHWRLNYYVEWILMKMDRNGKCNHTTSDINLRQRKSDWTVQNVYNNAV